MSVVDPSRDGAARRATDHQWVERIAESAMRLGRTVAVAESLTAGRISTLLGAGSSASDWFRGAVVAYDELVKFDVLQVTRGPVITDSCARQMAEGVRRVLHADVGMGLTGVGGPGCEEDQPPGRVYLAVADADGTRSRQLDLTGSPGDVIAQVTSIGLAELGLALEDLRAHETGTRHDQST